MPKMSESNWLLNRIDYLEGESDIRYSLCHSSNSVLLSSFYALLNGNHIEQRVFCYYSFTLHTYILHEFIGITSSSSNQFNLDVIDIVCMRFFSRHTHTHFRKRRREGKVSFVSVSIYVKVYTHTHIYTLFNWLKSSESVGVM